MIRSPILKVLSSMNRNGVKCLLMGGQACVLYGAAEFSRDTDLVILADVDNLNRLGSALDELQAECIAVPPFDSKYLEMGLALHFRCQHVDAQGMRIDIMAKMRGVDPFGDLWHRRTTLKIGTETIELLALPDLVQAKKTQRDKDWPMLARLVEANYFSNCEEPTEAQITFWFLQMRTPTLLIEIARRFPLHCARIAEQRELLVWAEKGDERTLRDELVSEEQREREADREYWSPLVEQLNALRTKR